MSLTVDHVFLVTADERDQAVRRALRFVKRSLLVSYDRIEIMGTPFCAADGTDFASLLNEALSANRDTLKELVRDLEREGYVRMQDLLNMPQGYLSKTLHTIAHLEDGFFGIDSVFYDIDEMACTLTRSRDLQLSQTPKRCWLVKIRATTEEGSGFERLKQADL